MRWGLFAGALLGVYLLQLAVLSQFGLRGLDPFLVLALCYALLTPAPDGRLAGWLIGLAQDFGSADVFGVHAFTLGLTAYLVTRMREWLNTSVWWARLVLLLAAAWPGQLLYQLHLHFWIADGSSSILLLLGRSLLVALLAAVLAMGLTSLPGLAVRRRRKGAMRRV